MAHDVYFSIPSRTLGRSDVEFQVYSDDEMLGTLKVSKGTIVWFPANTTYGFSLEWEKLDKIMRKEAKRFEKR